MTSSNCLFSLIKIVAFVEKAPKLHVGVIKNSCPYSASMYLYNILLGICLFSAGNPIGGATPRADVIGFVE